jgi:hypothetical protein
MDAPEISGSLKARKLKWLLLKQYSVSDGQGSTPTPTPTPTQALVIPPLNNLTSNLQKSPDWQN